MTELRVEEQPPEFDEWMAEHDLNDKEKELWNFHRWMRQETTLQSGSIVDYRKYVAEMLDEDGKLRFGKSDLDSSHKQAAFNKFSEYKKSRDNKESNGDTK